MSVICLHLVDPGLEGALMDVKKGAVPDSLINTRGEQFKIVPTGAFERHGDILAEVWVPEDMLTLWRLDVDR